MRPSLLVFFAAIAACAPQSGSSSLTRAPLLPQLAAASRTSSAAAPAPGLTPPVAKREPHELKLGDHTFTDDYFWLRQKGAPEVVSYLEAENAYTGEMTKALKPLEDTLYEESVSRLTETDSTPPEKFGDWLYYARTEKGKQYPIRCRRRAGTAKGDAGPGPGAGATAAQEVVLLDPNEIGKTESFVGIGETEVSDDGNLFAYTVDTVGYRQYTLHVKDLRTGKDLPEQMPRVDFVAFAADGKSLLYLTEDEQTKRQNQVHLHVLGTDVAKDPIVYDEKDAHFDLYLRRSRSLEFTVVTSISKTTTEVRLFDSRHATAPAKLVAPREAGHEYYVEPGKGLLYIRTNSGGRNFRLVTTPAATPERANWKEIVTHRADVTIEGVEAFSDHVVLTERKDAKVTLRSLDAKTGAPHAIVIDEEVYALKPAENLEFVSDTFRYAYSSPTTPFSVYEENIHNGSRKRLKRDEVPGFDPSRYASERGHATAKDGTQIPVSIIYSRGLMPDGSHPLFLYAYGAYGFPTDVGFDVSRLSLLDRGVVVAFAHVRGGGDLGIPWHDAGRMASKINTFTDFIDSAEWLVRSGWAKAGGIAIEGGSAGGLLMGAVTNMRPDLWRAVVAKVPFVDVIDTMSDETLPETTEEFEEWGNPRVPEQLGWLMAYSPYDNVTKKAYPPILVESSYNDSQVGYWEPAKWVAKLRAMKTDSNPLLLKMNMKPAGHGGASGRYEHLREIAFDYAFILTELGVSASGK